MELKRADVSLCVLFLFVQTLFELAVLLEAALFGHLLLLLFCLDSATLGTEVLDFAVKQLVFAELTLQRTIEEGNLDRGLQTNLVKAFLTVRQYPGVVARKLVFQTLANHLVGAQQVGG